MQAVILAGGLGTRLRPLTNRVPKVMLPVKGKPFIVHLLRLLEENGIHQVVLCVGYLGEQVKEYLGGGEGLGIGITYSKEREGLLGTGGALRRARNLLDECFYVINGDTYLPVNYGDVEGSFINCGRKALMVVYDNRDDSGMRNNVELDNSMVIRHQKDKLDPAMKYVDAGVLVLNREVLDFIEDGSSVSLEEGLYPPLIEQGELAAYITEQKFYDIGTAEHLKAFEGLLEGKQGMIITRTPLRVSFVGGGTDLSEFYRVEAGAVVSTAINKYMYIVVNQRFDDTIRISYSKTEIVTDVEEIQHPIVREVLKLVGITNGIEIVSIADIPAGTGLGSSSSFTVGLLNALYAYKGVLKSAEELAREACHIEIDILGEPIGKQDQYIAAYGGFRYIQFNPDETVFTEPIIYDKENKSGLTQNLLLFYTGDTRQAGSILTEQRANTRHSDKMDFLKKIRNLTLELRTQWNNGASPDILGDFLYKGWLLKKQLALGITNSTIDEYYENALKAGTLGGKILGAGGGGFLLLYCPREKQAKVREALSDLTLTEFSLEPEGSKIIYVI